ncbi:MAG TPA: hypothetical protein VN767_23175 [Streptosporangiaceae bacterium]|jgi:hypothetical protein|nr:hypothetical protein [Streptosporangiaceae bacterium]
MSDWRSARIGLLEATDPAAVRLVDRLLTVAQRTLRRSYLGDEFAFTLRGDRLAAEGTSLRYGAIASLGLAHLPDQAQRAILVGEDSDDLIGRLAKGLDRMTDRGDVALICLAAAEAGHGELPHATGRLAELDRRLLSGEPGDAIDVVAAAWVVTALVAARAAVDVELHLDAARQRLLGARRVAFPHRIGGGQKWYRAHVGSFADQIYPVQALARLHASAADQAALTAAEQVARVICRAQGPAGQWWWHYDARTGAVVEGYPVYSVHQHAMAPMGLLDLAEAGGEDHLTEIRRGLRWMAGRPETTEPLIAADKPVIWRKVGRNDPRKLVRGLAAARSAVLPGTSMPGIGLLFPPRTVDYECRPYELGWMLYAWLSGGARSSRPNEGAA